MFLWGGNNRNSRYDVRFAAGGTLSWFTFFYTVAFLQRTIANDSAKWKCTFLNLYLIVLYVLVYWVVTAQCLCVMLMLRVSRFRSIHVFVILKARNSDLFKANSYCSHSNIVLVCCVVSVNIQLKLFLFVYTITSIVCGTINFLGFM